MVVCIFTWRLTPNCDESNEETEIHTNAPVVQWRQSTKRVSDVSLPISLHLPHLSAIVSIIRSHFPLCLRFTLSISLLLPSTIPLLPSRGSAHGPDPVVPGFQMVWLAEGSQLTPQQPFFSHPQTPGGLGRYRLFQAGWEVEDKERDRGLREDCVTAEAVNNWLLSSNSFRLLAAPSELFEARAHTFYYQSELCGRLEQKMVWKKNGHIILQTGIWKWIQGSKGGSIRDRDSVGQGWQLVTPH